MDLIINQEQTIECLPLLLPINEYFSSTFSVSLSLHFSVFGAKAGVVTSPWLMVPSSSPSPPSSS